MSKKLLYVLALCCLLIGAFVLPVSAQEGERWVGSDDLPTAPLECPAGAGGAAEEAATDEMATEEASAAPAYDGGVAANAPDLAGQPITIVDIPKLIGIGYFNATSAGIQQAAEELGNVNATTDGPTEGDITAQIEFIENYITQGVNGILFAANDPVAI